jgi:IS5 family transposase
MEKRQTFTGMEYAQQKRASRREASLETMNEMAPRQRLEEKIRPHCFPEKRGARQRGYRFRQAWFNLADEAAEEQIYDSIGRGNQQSRGRAAGHQTLATDKSALL